MTTSTPPATGGDPVSDSGDGGQSSPPVDPPAPAASQAGPATIEDAVAEAAKWKAMARKHERAQLDALGLKSVDELEQLRAKAAKADEIELASMTAEQQATARATAAETAAIEAQRELARWQVAAATGVDAALLSGDTPEALTASAEALLAWAAQRAGSQPAAPGQAFGGSVDGGPLGAGGGAATIDQQIADAQAKGDVSRLIALNGQKLAGLGQ